MTLPSARFAQADQQAAVVHRAGDPVVEAGRQGNAPLETPLRKLER